jgi:hypothetical protein
MERRRRERSGEGFEKEKTFDFKALLQKRLSYGAFGLPKTSRLIPTPSRFQDIVLLCKKGPFL